LPAARFEVDRSSGELVVRDPKSDAEVRRLLPGGRRVREVVAVGARCVVLAERDPSTKNDPNLRCVDDSGRLLWTAALPDPSGPDCFVAVELEGGQLFANSWSGYRVALDLSTGATRERRFTK
jgi:hypothetical protein